MIRHYYILQDNKIIIECAEIVNRNQGKWDNRVSKFMIIGMKEQLDMINKVVGTVTIGFAVLLSIITGLLSGFYPAIRASRLIPHEALRYE